MPAPVVDFHLHCYHRPLRAPESFIAFMDRELARTHGSFAKFLERHGSAESYLRVLDDAGADYGAPRGFGSSPRGCYAGPKPTAVWFPMTSGRKRTGRPTPTLSTGMSTIRPRIDTPSLSFTTARA